MRARRRAKRKGWPLRMAAPLESQATLECIACLWFRVLSWWVFGRRCPPSTHLYEQTMWPDRRIIELFKTEFPIVQAPMAGIMDAELVIAAAQGGALGSLPCAMLTPEKA